MAARNQKLFEIGAEYLAIDRAVQNKERVDPIVTQGGEERHGTPVAMWCATDQAPAVRCPTPQGRHVGLGPGFVDEDKPARADPAPMPFPAGAAAAHIGAVLLLGELGLFF